MPTYTNYPPSEPAEHRFKNFSADVKKNGGWTKQKKFDLVWSVKNGARALEEVLLTYEMDISEYRTWVRQYNAALFNAFAPRHAHLDHARIGK
jgi:hypothetical protein